MADAFTLSAEEAAAQLGVTVRSVARYCEAGIRAAKTKTHDPRSLVCHKDEKTDRTGERWRIDPASVERFRKAHNIASPDMSRHVETRLDNQPQISSPVQTRPDGEAILSHVRSEAAKHKAKWESERERRIEETQRYERRIDKLEDEKSDMTDRLIGATAQAHALQTENRDLKNRLLMLDSGRVSTVTDVEPQDVSANEHAGLDKTGQDSTDVQTGLDKSRQDETDDHNEKDNASQPIGEKKSRAV